MACNTDTDMLSENMTKRSTEEIVTYFIKNTIDNNFSNIYLWFL